MTDRKPSDAEIVAKHYLIAAAWADAPEGSRPRPPRDTIRRANRLAWLFLELIGAEAVDQVRDAHESGYGTHPDCGRDRPWLAAMGHDLWLTSQRHGVGFWDREVLPKPLRDRLTLASRRFENIGMHCYRGWIYLHGAAPVSLKLD